MQLFYITEHHAALQRIHSYLKSIFRPEQDTHILVTNVVRYTFQKIIRAVDKLRHSFNNVLV